VTGALHRSPARSHTPLSRRLRALTGVNEEVLDGIPTERPRYTAMGAVILGTACIAAVSMGAALSFVLHGWYLLGLLVVPGWGLFILAIDRWLMSTVSAAGFGKRLVRLLPRVLLSIAIGAIVAEPLLLIVFDSAIVERAKHDRADEIVDLQSTLIGCNPVPGTAEADAPAAKAPECARHHLSIAGFSLDGQRGELADLQQQAGTLAAQLKTDSDQLAVLESDAQKECTGTGGPGFTGQRGEGPNCRYRRGLAETYRDDHQIPQNTEKLAALQQRIKDISGNIGTGADDFAKARQAAIEIELQKARDRQKDIGLLERMRTLGEITAENGYARTGEWALRIFLIIVDALPVLIKFLGGFSTYDAIVTDRLAREEQMQRKVNETRQYAHALHEDLVRKRLEQRHQINLQWSALDALRYGVALDTKREQLVDDRAEYLADDAPTAQLSPGAYRGDDEPTQAFGRFPAAPPHQRTTYVESTVDETPPVDR
jgi:hypothetical protein